MLARGDFERNGIPQSATVTSLKPAALMLLTRCFASFIRWCRQSRGGFLLTPPAPFETRRRFCLPGSRVGEESHFRVSPADAILLPMKFHTCPRDDNQYHAFGTPFTGELNKPGENVSAPVSALYLLAKGSESASRRSTAAEAVRCLLSNILFFAKDDELVQALFHSAFEFCSASRSQAHVRARCPGVGVNWMSSLYVSRNSRVAARILDGEMMIMSGRDSSRSTLEPDGNHPVAIGRWDHSSGAHRRAADLPGV